MDQNKKLFPQRLWELVHDEKYDFCLRWSPDGQKIYLNRNEFEAHYLRTPNNQFHTKKAISFVRQMNMYGFRKVDDCYYENDNFKRNCHHLLKNMIRRHSNKPNNGHQSVSANNPALGCSINDGHSFHSMNNGNGSSNPALADATTATSGMMNPASTNHSGACSPQTNFRDLVQQEDQPMASIQTFYRQFTGLNSAAALNNLTGTFNHPVMSYLNNDEANPTQVSPNTTLPDISPAAAVSPSSSSTLYQRLAALNFGVARGGLYPEQIEQSQQLPALNEQVFQKIYTLPEQNRSVLTFNNTSNLAQQMSMGVQPVDLLSLSPEQQTLAARQALFQQTLVGSLLRLRQPQTFMPALDNNFLATLRQNANLVASQNLLDPNAVNRVMESADPSDATELHQNDSPDGPLELVVDSPRSSSSSNQQNLERQLSSSNLSTNTRSNDYVFNMTSQSSNSGPSRWSSPNQRDDDFVDDEDSFCSNDDEAFDLNTGHM